MYNKNNTAQKFRTYQSPPDIPLMIIIGCLAVLGVSIVFSSSVSHGIQDFNDQLYFFKKQLLSFGIGTVVMFFFSNFSYKKFQTNITFITNSTIMLLVATALFGSTIYGSKRWLLGFQPSEIAKFTCVAILADAIVRSKSIFDEYFIKKAVSICIILGLIMLQPDLGTTIVIFMGCLAVCVAGGISLQLLLSGFTLFATLAGFSILAMPHQRERIEGWLNPWADPYDKGYNLIHSLYAISAGGFWGAGFGNSKQKLLWLPLGHIDFIFAIYAEEMGFLGCLLLVGLFMAFMHRGFLIGKRCQYQFGSLLAYGMTFCILFQAIVNICVATGLMPVTGVTLPLISYGGTSVIITMAMIGILLNISRQKIKRAIND